VQLGAAGLVGRQQALAARRDEKPFGHDLDSAAPKSKHWSRTEGKPGYRIDHYLGKETVQKIFWSFDLAMDYLSRFEIGTY